MVEADFNSAVTVADYVLPSTKAVTQTDANRGFQTFKCTVDVGISMTCSKLQLWPAASYSGGFRFENGNRVEAYYYDFAQAGTPRWTKNRTFFLEGATTLVAIASAFTAMLMTF